MSFKEEFNKEKGELLKNKRPYETAAFIVFAVMFLQQFGLLLYRLFDYLFNSNQTFFSTASLTTPVFFGRIVGINSSKFIYVLLGLIALFLWYFIIYLLVYRYCQKRNMAKWTWTTLIMFGPTILFMPPYIFYAIYVFRPYFFRFIKTVVEEYKAYNPKQPFPEEIEEPAPPVEVKEEPEPVQEAE